MRKDHVMCSMSAVRLLCGLLDSEDAMRAVSETDLHGIEDEHALRTGSRRCDHPYGPLPQLGAAPGASMMCGVGGVTVIN